MNYKFIKKFKIQLFVLDIFFSNTQHKIFHKVEEIYCNVLAVHQLWFFLMNVLGINVPMCCGLQASRKVDMNS